MWKKTDSNVKMNIPYLNDWGVVLVICLRLHVLNRKYTIYIVILTGKNIKDSAEKTLNMLQKNIKKTLWEIY